MGRASSYTTTDSTDIAIGRNLWGFMQECTTMDFFQDKEELDKCFFEVTAEQVAAMKAAISPADAAVANKAILASVVSAIKDPACADLKAEFCGLLSADLTFTGSGA